MHDINNAEIQALITERDMWLLKNEECWESGDDPCYTEEDFADMVVAFRQLAGEEINME